MPIDYAKRKKYLTSALPPKVRRASLSITSWKVPSGDEVKEVIELINLTDVAIAEKLRIETRTIRKWKSGNTDISLANWFCLCWLAGLGPMLAEHPASPP